MLYPVQKIVSAILMLFYSVLSVVHVNFFLLIVFIKFPFIAINSSRAGY